MGIFIREKAKEDEETNFYVLANNDSLRTDVNLPVAAEPIRFYTWNLKERVRFILPEELDQVEIKMPAKVIIMQEDREMAERVKAKVSLLEIKKVRIGSLPASDDGTVNFNPVGIEGFLNPPIPIATDFTILE